jgi:hypothetical protein
MPFTGALALRFLCSSFALSSAAPWGQAHRQTVWCLRCVWSASLPRLASGGLHRGNTGEPIGVTPLCLRAMATHRVLESRLQVFEELVCRGGADDRR